MQTLEKLVFSRYWKLMVILSIHASVFSINASETGSASYQLQTPGTLRIGVYTNFAPYSNRMGGSGKFKGIDVDLGIALADRLGLNYSFLTVKPDENMDDDLRNFLWKGHYLGGGVADVMMHVPYDKIYSKKVDQVYFFAPYQQERTAVAYNAATYSTAPDIVKAAERGLGVEIDTISDYYTSSVYNGSIRDSVKRYFTVTEAVEAMLGGQVAAVMAPRGELQGALASLGSSVKAYEVANVTMIGMFRSIWQVGLGVSMNNKNLAADLENAMQKMIEDGSLVRIFASHGVSLELPE